MQPYTMLISLRRSETHLRLLSGQQLMLQGTLPPPAEFWAGKPVKALLESLAIWLNVRLHVVVDAADRADGFTLELTDEGGTGLRTVFYDVQVREPRGRRCRKHRPGAQQQVAVGRGGPR